MSNDKRDNAAQHTPGPWRFDGQAGATLAFAKKHDTALMVRARGATVAEVIPHGTATEPNARLIAAAPELLEALKACLESFSQAHAHRKLKAASDGSIICACDLARAAIAKATGADQ